MGRKSSREMVGKIVSFLNEAETPVSITEISEEIGSDRKAVKSYLDELVKTGLVKTEKDGRKKIYYISSYENRDTYFNLPLDKRQKEMLETVFGTIKEKYEEKTNKPISKAKAQKVAVGALKHCGLDLDLPYGSYKYGSITMMSFTPTNIYSKNTETFPGWEEMERCIEEKIEEYTGKSFKEVRRQQYEKENMELYISKEKIQDMLSGEVEKDKLQRELYRFLSNTPNMDKEAGEYITDFVSMAPKLVNTKEGRSTTLKAFSEIWEMVAIYRLYSDLEKYYSEKMLDTRLRGKIDEAKMEAEEALTEMADEVEYAEPDEEFKDLQGSGRKLSEEEKKEREKELEDMDSSDLAGKFGIDTS